MSNHLISIAYKADVGSLLRKSVLVLMCDKASDDGSGVWASKQTMADELCCSKQSIINTMRQFVSERLVSETGRREHHNGYTVEYRIDVALLEALPKVERWRDQSKTFTSQPRLPLNRVDRGSQPRLPKPSRTPRKAKEAKAPLANRAKFILPADIPAEPWADYEDMRNRMGKRMTDKARTLAVTRLRKLRDEDGWPPGDVLNNSTLNSYQGLFPPKDDRNGRPQPSLRGTRPDPALDLLRAAERAEEAERADREDHRGIGPPLQAIGRC